MTSSVENLGTINGNGMKDEGTILHLYLYCARGDVTRVKTMPAYLVLGTILYCKDYCCPDPPKPNATLKRGYQTHNGFIYF